MFSSRIWRRQRSHGRGLKNGGSQFSRAIQKQLIETTAFDCDLGVVAGRKIDAQPTAADSNKINAIEFAVRQSPDTFGKLKPPEHRPARRVDAIAANFLARKILALQDRGAQTRRRAKCRAARSGWATADDREIEHFPQSRKAERPQGTAV